MTGNGTRKGTRNGSLRRTGNGTLEALRKLAAYGSHEKALTANVMTEKYGNHGLRSKAQTILKWQSVVIWRRTRSSKIRASALRRSFVRGPTGPYLHRVLESSVQVPENAARHFAPIR